MWEGIFLQMNKNGNLVCAFIDEVLNHGDIEATGKCFHEDFVEQAPFPGQGPGLNGLKDVLPGFRDSVPGHSWSIEEQIEEGGKVVSRFVWSGTHQAEFLGVPATGRAVSVWGIAIDRMLDGTIKESRIIMDTLGLMTQMGGLAAAGKLKIGS